VEGAVFQALLVKKYRSGEKHMSPRRMLLLAVPAFVAIAAMVTPAEAG
jgi:hypothetical protein